MKGTALLLAGLTALTVAGAAAPADSEEPKDVGLKESAKVELVQLEVTVWPQDPEADACLGLTADDFELRVNHRPHPIYAVDALGPMEEVYTTGSTTAGESPAAGGIAFVLFFDLWHLDLFSPAYSACPRTKPLAFDEARRFVREGFHEGDRLLLVTFAGWPIVHYGWIRTQTDALGALDRLEKNRQVLAPPEQHVHHERWIQGIESLLLALGRYPGRKDVIYLGDDFRFDDVALRMYEIAARAQSNGVVVSSVDLIGSCRTVPGFPCPSHDKLIGLACTPFKTPVALGPIASATGGQLFPTEHIATAAKALRSIRQCRYLVSFRQGPLQGKRSPVVALNLRDKHRGLSLRAPSSFLRAGKRPTQREQDEALFLLPHFGRGIAAEVGVWPYRPAGKRGRWNALVLTRVERVDEEPWPEELTEITVSVVLHQESRIYGAVRKTIGGDDLKALRETGRTPLMVFPVEGVRPGDATADLTVVGNAEQISANIHRSFSVPHPPGPGEARPWFLADRLVRFGDHLVPVPSLDDTVPAGETVSFIAYGCDAETGAPSTHEGRLVRFGGGPPVPVAVTWLEGPDRPRGRCGWLVGRSGHPPPPGLWTFEPPASLGAKETSAVEFNVVSPTPSEDLPEELTAR